MFCFERVTKVKNKRLFLLSYLFLMSFSMQCSFGSGITYLLNDPKFRVWVHEMIKWGFDIYFEDEEVKQANARLKKQEEICDERERKMKASCERKELESKKKYQEKMLIQGIQAQASLKYDKLDTEIKNIEKFIKSAYRPGDKEKWCKKRRDAWRRYAEVGEWEQQGIQKIREEFR